jgi:2-dehydropantoate 2-reductase
MKRSPGVKLAVVGAGGVGGYLAALLARSGAWVAVLTRGDSLAAIREHGIRVESPRGDFQVAPALASEHPAEIGRVDGVILAVKAWEVADAARALRPLLGPETRVLTVQNGVEAPEQLAPILGGRHALAGTCRMIASRTAPGCIRDAGVEPAVALGELDGSPLSPGATVLAAALAAAGVRVETPADIRAALWEKLLMIAPFSGAGSMTRSSIGEIRDSAPSRELLKRIAEEVDAVARALGVRLREDAVARTLAFLDSLPAAGTSSMQRDLAAERPCELEAIVGAVVRLGDRTDVSTPTLDVVYASLLPQERRARARSAAHTLEGSPRP